MPSSAPSPAVSSSRRPRLRAALARLRATGPSGRPARSTRRRSAAGAVAGAVVLALVGCSGGGPAPTSSSAAAIAPHEITHDAGVTTVPGAVSRVVALEFSFVETLDLFDVAPVGIADDDDPGRIEQLLGERTDYTSVGTRAEPNQELIASLKPDLIIADTDRHSAVYPQLAAIAPTLVLNSREGGYDDMKANTVTIADALGDRPRGEAVVAEHEARMRDIAASIPAGESRTVQLVSARADLLRMFTSASFAGSVLSDIGLRVAVQSDQPYEDAGLERIAAVDPDVLLIASDVDAPITDQWATNPVWQGMTAVRGSAVHDVDRNLYTRFRGLRTAERVAQETVDLLVAR